MKFMSLLEVKDLKTYFFTQKGPVKAADGVQFMIRKGESFGLAGESGCGKSTTALSIMKLVPPPGQILGGKIIFEGMDITQMNEDEMRDLRWKEISIIFQGAMNALNPVLTVGRQIADGILAHEDVTKDEALERAQKQLELVGIGGERISNYQHEFSGGMRQRVMIAMALACNPKLVIADEPVTALDVIVQRQILSLMNELQRKLHLSTMLITHDLSVIADICDTIAIMYAGKIVEYADVKTVFKHPIHPYTEALIEAYPSVIGKKKSLKSIPGSPPDLLNPPSGCRFYPRCTYARDVCHMDEPRYVEIKKGHSVACHLHH